MKLTTKKPVLEMTQKEFEIVQEFFRTIMKNDNDSWFEEDEYLRPFLEDSAIDLKDSEYLDIKITR